MATLESRTMLTGASGILLVDKPAQLSAHDVLKAVKSRFNLTKIGHGGTLEPNATGLFVLLVGEATCVANDVMGGDRAYQAVMRLGRVTNTQDAEGTVLEERAYADATREAFEAVLPEFRGDIFQTPPPFSVIKRPDRPSYDVVPAAPEDLKARLAHVYRLRVTDFTLPLVGLELLCSKGVNVRALVHDLGQRLGPGASLETLRRTACDRFRIEDAIGFMELLKLDAVSFKHRLLSVAGAFA